MVLISSSMNESPISLGKIIRWMIVSHGLIPCRVENGDQNLPSEKESVVQFKEAGGLRAFAVKVNRSFLAWSRNGLTRKILNG